MLENASLMSENMDQSLVPELTLWRRGGKIIEVVLYNCKIFEADCKADCKTAIYSKQLGVQHSSTAITTLYNSIQSAECICHVHSLCAFCHFIGATNESETQIHAQKWSTSETRRSSHGWRCWHATLGLAMLAAIFFPRLPLS